MSAALLGTFPVGSWAWHTQAREPVRIIEVENLWGQTTYLVGRVGAAGLERVPASDLELLEARRDHNPDRLGRGDVLDAASLDGALHGVHTTY